MKIIGLTGGIASGKSTVSAELKKMGVSVFDADEASRNAVAKGSKGLALVAEALGSQYLTPDGELDRAKVSKLVFADAGARGVLEKIIHHIVWEEAEAFIQKHADKGAPAVVLDVPLLIECGWHKHCSSVWLVSLPQEQQVSRAMKRSGLSEKEVRARISAQMPLAEKLRYADTVIDNSGSLQDTLAQVRSLAAGLRS